MMADIQVEKYLQTNPHQIFEQLGFAFSLIKKDGREMTAPEVGAQFCRVMLHCCS